MIQVVECTAALPHSLTPPPPPPPVLLPSHNLITLYLQQAKLTFAPIHYCIVRGDNIGRGRPHHQEIFSLPAF